MLPQRQVTLLLWHTGWRLLHTDKLTHMDEQLQLGHWRDTKRVSLQWDKSELKRAKAEPKRTLSKAREKSPTGSPAHAAPCSAQFLVSWTQRGRSGTGGRLSHALLVAQGRVVVIADELNSFFSPLPPLIHHQPQNFLFHICIFMGMA